MKSTLSLFRRMVPVLALLVPGSALAHDYQAGALKIGHPWTRATVPAQTTAAGYLSVQNTGRQVDRLIGARAADAERVEMHISRIENDIAKMREVKSFRIPAGGTLKLQPGGSHLMLIGTKRPFKPGERIPVLLRFEKAGEVAVDLSVEALKPAPAESHQH
jgi:copper(I)-binding protein